MMSCTPIQPASIVCFETPNRLNSNRLTSAARDDETRGRKATRFVRSRLWRAVINRLQSLRRAHRRRGSGAACRAIS
jgi:hypothetical protein